MPWQRHSTLLPSLLGILLSTIAPVRAWAQGIGNVSAVNPAATGTAPGSAPKTIFIGQEVVFNQRVQTSGEGTAQIAFADRSTISIGRNSDIRIDQFVYAPGADGGQMSISLTKGVLRFVGGQISHTDGATIKTPVASVGIRGGVGTVAFNGAGGGSGSPCPSGALVLANVGNLTVKNSVSSVTISKAGYGVCVTGPNDPIGAPFLVSQAILQAFLQNTTSKPGQDGGANDLPTDQMASKFGLEFPKLDPPNNPTGSPFSILSIINGGNSASGGNSQNNQMGESSCYWCSSF